MNCWFYYLLKPMKVSALHQNVLLFVVNTVPEQMDYMAVTSCFVFRRFWEFSLNPCVYYFIVNMVVVQSLSCVWLFGIPWTAAYQASLSFTISQSLLKFMFIESVMLSNHLIFYCPLLLLLSFFPSIRVFSSESALLHQVAKVLELQHQFFQWIFRVDFL